MSPQQVAQSFLLDELDALKRKTESTRWLWVAAILFLVAGFGALLWSLDSQRKAEQRRADQFQQSAQALQTEIERVRLQLSSGDIDAARQTLHVAQAQAQQLATDAAIEPASVPSQLIYVQYEALSDSAVAAIIGDLKSDGWNVAADKGEHVASARGLNEIRYGPESDRAAAEQLAQRLIVELNRPVSAHEVRIVHAGILEVWISGTAPAAFDSSRLRAVTVQPPPPAPPAPER